MLASADEGLGAWAGREGEAFRGCHGGCVAYPARLSRPYTLTLTRSNTANWSASHADRRCPYPRFTALDAVGPFEVLAFLPGAQTVLVAEQPGPVTDETGSMVIDAAAGFGDVLRPDVVVVPGGPGQIGQMSKGALHGWLRAVDRTCTWMTSVCTGSLVLAAAGLLTGRRATTHWLAIDQLPSFGVTPVQERVVVDGHYVTAAGVSAGIDMALTLAGRIAGDEVAQARQLSIEYSPEPPYDAGTPASAPAAVLQRLLDRREEILTGQP